MEINKLNVRPNVLERLMMNFCSLNKRAAEMKVVDKKSTKGTRKNKKYVLGQKAVGQLSYTR